MLNKMFGGDVLDRRSGGGRSQWVQQHFILQAQEEKEVHFIGQAFEAALGAQEAELAEFLASSHMWKSEASTPGLVHRILMFLGELASYNLLGGAEQEALVRSNLAEACQLANLIVRTHYFGTAAYAGAAAADDAHLKTVRDIIEETDAHPTSLVLLLLAIVFSRGSFPQEAQLMQQQQPQQVQAQPGGSDHGRWSFESLLWVDQCQLYYFRLLQKHLHTRGPSGRKRRKTTTAAAVASWPTRSMGKLIRVMTLLKEQA